MKFASSFYISSLLLLIIFRVDFAVAQVGGQYWPDGHTAAISASWPEEPGGPDGHAHYWSLQFGNGPANHMYALSKTWWNHPGVPTWPVQNPPTVHNLAASENHGWPAGHGFDQSRWWNAPSNHNKEISRRWTGGHTADTSRTWPEPENHDISATRLWPPNHNSTRSSTHVPGSPDDHDTGISQTHQVPAPSHNATSSTYWPPNHYRLTSNTWSPTHDRAISSSWNGGHAGALSILWPPGGGIYWPPNHVADVSYGWGIPNNPGWPVFPPDHSWLTTATTIAGAIPTIEITPISPKK